MGVGEMIIDETGRELKPGQIIHIPVLSLTGSMVPAQIVETNEPSGLTVPNSVTQNPPFVGIVITLRLVVRPLANPNSKTASTYLCDNVYVVREALERIEPKPNGGRPELKLVE
jgi:hypothetical protein